MREPELYCVRADFGRYTENFIKGGYIAAGWLEQVNLENINSREQLYPLYKKFYPEDTSNIVIGQQVGQIARFLLEIQPGDYVITPGYNSDEIFYGVVQENPTYFYFTGNDGCPYRHRRSVKWNPKPAIRNSFSIPFQNTIKSSLTVYYISHKNNFFEVIGKTELNSKEEIKYEYDYYTSVLNSILNLDPTEFELLITNILSAVGFEGSQHTGKKGDGGVDATGILNIYNMANMKIYVQVKRYKLDARIDANTVKALRQSIPVGGQGAFITTCNFTKEAEGIAIQDGFPRIGLINGRKLVDILVDNWAKILPEFKEKLKLTLGLVSI